MTAAPNPMGEATNAAPGSSKSVQSASPLDVMLSAMRDAHETAQRVNEVRKRLESILSLDSLKNREIMAQLGVMAAEYQAKAVDIATKAAPYVHPRLASQSVDLDGSMNFAQMSDDDLKAYIESELSGK